MVSFKAACSTKSSTIWTDCCKFSKLHFLTWVIPIFALRGDDFFRGVLCVWNSFWSWGFLIKFLFPWNDGFFRFVQFPWSSKPFFDGRGGDNWSCGGEGSIGRDIFKFSALSKIVSHPSMGREWSSESEYGPDRLCRSDDMAWIWSSCTMNVLLSPFPRSRNNLFIYYYNVWHFITLGYIMSL